MRWRKHLWQKRRLSEAVDQAFIALHIFQEMGLITFGYVEETLALQKARIDIAIPIHIYDIFATSTVEVGTRTREADRIINIAI